MDKPKIYRAEDFKHEDLNDFLEFVQGYRPGIVELYFTICATARGDFDMAELGHISKTIKEDNQQ